MTLKSENVLTMAIFEDMSGFQIKSKYDAAVFMNDIFRSGHFAIMDERNPKMHYLLSKGVDGVARIVREKNDKEWYSPEYMYQGEQAVAVAFAGRKSINKYLREMGA